MAVVLAIASAALFGAMTVALRLALFRNPDAVLGAAVTVLVAFLVALSSTPVASGELRARDLMLFALAGALAPGFSQLLFALAVRDAGAARTSVVVGGAPLVSVVLGLAVLGEPLHAGLVAAARRPWRRPLAFVPAGLCFGLSYVFLFEAYYRGRVTVVSPLVATESLWGVGLSALLIGRSELIGRRLVVGALLIVAGGALVGSFR